MPTLNASVEVLALPEPANEPVEVLPWNGLTPAQQAAAAELVEQWRGDSQSLRDFKVSHKESPAT